MQFQGAKQIAELPVINGFGRHQVAFSSLKDAITCDNEVRFIDAFADKLDLKQLCFLAVRRPPFHYYMVGNATKRLILGTTGAFFV